MRGILRHVCGPLKHCNYHWIKNITLNWVTGFDIWCPDFIFDFWNIILSQYLYLIFKIFWKSNTCNPYYLTVLLHATYWNIISNGSKGNLFHRIKNTVVYINRYYHVHFLTHDYSQENTDMCSKPSEMAICNDGTTRVRVGKNKNQEGDDYMDEYPDHQNQYVHILVKYPQFRK